MFEYTSTADPLFWFTTRQSPSFWASSCPAAGWNPSILGYPAPLDWDVCLTTTNPLEFLRLNWFATSSAFGSPLKWTAGRPEGVADATSDGVAYVPYCSASLPCPLLSSHDVMLPPISWTVEESEASSHRSLPVIRSGVKIDPNGCVGGVKLEA
ncbi:hypothetical protein EBZ39_05195 [bacterium]|nr:hypothetical protein [bacterium]